MKRKIYLSHIKIKAKPSRNKAILARCYFKLKIKEQCQDRIINKLNNIIKKRVLKHRIEYKTTRASIMEIKHNLQVIRAKQIKICKS